MYVKQVPKIYIKKNLNNLKKIKSNSTQYNFENWGTPNSHRVLAITFLTSFQATFIFNASQLELSIKSYDHLKFFHPKFWQLKIYDKSI